MLHKPRDKRERAGIGESSIDLKGVEGPTVSGADEDVKTSQCAKLGNIFIRFCICDGLAFDGSLSIRKNIAVNSYHFLF